MRALWGRMKMPPWLKILSTGAEVEKYSRSTLRDQDQDQDQDRKYQDQDQDQDLRSQLSRPRRRPRPGKIGLECSQDQDRGLEDYILATRAKTRIQILQDR